MLPRYAFINEYTREELNREYANLDAAGRLRLLERLREDVPFEIAEQAANDLDVRVRQWIARHGTRFVAKPASSSGSANGRANLQLVLSNDPDLFVRACLRENPSASLPFRVQLETMSQLERLATVRNPEFSLLNTETLRVIFDPAETAALSLEQKVELIRALLTNRKFLSDTHREHDGYGFDENTAMIWTLASKWPKNTFVPHLVYRHVGLPRGVVISDVLSRADSDIVEAILDNESISRSQLWKCRLRLSELGEWKWMLGTLRRPYWRSARTLTAAHQMLDQLKSQRKGWLIILLIVAAVEFFTHRLDRYDC